MPDYRREFEPIRFWDWLTGWMCLETKIGVGLVLLGGALLAWTDWRIPGIDWSIGYLVLVAGVAFSLGSLGRDCRLLVQQWRKGTEKRNRRP